MSKASGCLNSTPTEAVEILTNTEPIDLQLKLRHVLRNIEMTDFEKSLIHGQKAMQLWEGNQQSSSC